MESRRREGNGVAHHPLVLNTWMWMECPSSLDSTLPASGPPLLAMRGKILIYLPTPPPRYCAPKLARAICTRIRSKRIKIKLQ